MASTQLLQFSVIASLVIQIITAIVDTWALTWPIKPQYKILTQLISLELIVQIVEATFYVWLVYNISSVNNITPKRYYDWFITTPTMLFTIIVYFIYVKHKESGKDTKNLDMYDVFQQEKKTLIPIFVLNNIMLIAGLYGENNPASLLYSSIVGFAAFAYYFYIIYKNYVVDNPSIQNIFYVFLLLWSLYGVAAQLAHNSKNIAYNILDLFSKNFFGVWLAYVLYISVYN